MLTAHYYSGNLGITPAERGRLAYEQRQRQRAARVKLGPFTFSSQGSTVKVPGRLQPIDRLPRVWTKWLKRSVAKASIKYMFSGASYLKGWGQVASTVARGNIPVAKIENPQDKGGNWGLYVKLGSNKLTEITFKKVPRSDWGFLGDIGSGVASVVGGVVDGANAVGSGVISAVKTIPRVAGAVAGLACDVITNPSTQQAAALAQNVPNPYAQGAAIGTKIGAGICNAIRGQQAGLPGPAPIQPAVVSAAAQPTPKTLAQRLPPGSIQAQIPGTDKWAYAIPKAAALAPLSGSGLGFVSPWSGRDFISPYVRPRRDQYAQRQYSWFDVNTADRPYRAAWGLAQPFTVVGTGEKSATATVVDPETLKSKTTPIYKKWWFWVAIAGGAASLGTGSYLVFRRK